MPGRYQFRKRIEVHAHTSLVASASLRLLYRTSDVMYATAFEAVP